jgi:hypothetical protein
LAIERNWGEDRKFDALITSHKDREDGARKSFKFMFSKRSLRFYSNATYEHTSYGWEKMLKESKKDEWLKNPVKATEEFTLPF